MGLELMNREIMTRAEIKSGMLNPLSHPGAPRETLEPGIHSAHLLPWSFVVGGALDFLVFSGRFVVSSDTALTAVGDRNMPVVVLPSPIHMDGYQSLE